MSDLIPAHVATEMATVMAGHTEGPSFVANRKISQAFYQGLRAAHFSIGDFISREEAHPTRLSTDKKREATVEARQSLWRLAGELEVAGYKISLYDEGACLEVGW